jgi:aspartyl-tRNA(Asn)/glutamyl-tRNA(Gln) amidotransferase subunit A
VTAIDLEATDATALAQRLRGREVSAVEVTRAYLERIAALDPDLGAYITVSADEALREAGRADALPPAERATRPLHGVPYAAKDLFHTAGIRTTGGSRALESFVPGDDATAVSRLRDAGAILLGKTNLTEFGVGPEDLYAYAEPRNPWDRTRVPGASSGGSAIAVAASLAAFALGTDTGGSSRGPAALCGIVGLRPTWGRVSRYGVMPSSWSTDTAGVMTRTVADCALVLGIVAGPDPSDPSSSARAVQDYLAPRDLRGMRAVIVEEWVDPETTDPDVVSAVEDAAHTLETLGIGVDRVRFPRANDAAAIFAIVSKSDAAFYQRDLLRARARHGTHFRRQMLAASLIPSQVLQKAQRLRAQTRDEWRALFARWDLVLSPTISRPAEPISHVGEIDTPEAALRAFGFPRIQRHVAALAGTPALSIPCGASREGLPIGLQLMADAFEEHRLFAVAAAYERATRWHERRPPLSVKTPAEAVRR